MERVVDILEEDEVECSRPKALKVLLRDRYATNKRLMSRDFNEHIIYDREFSTDGLEWRNIYFYV